MPYFLALLVKWQVRTYLLKYTIFTSYYCLNVWQKRTSIQNWVKIAVKNWQKNLEAMEKLSTGMEKRWMIQLGSRIEFRDTSFTLKLDSMSHEHNRFKCFPNFISIIKNALIKPLPKYAMIKTWRGLQSIILSSFSSCL